MNIQKNYMSLSSWEQNFLDEVLDFPYGGLKPINGQAIGTLRELCDAIDLTLEYSDKEIARPKTYTYTYTEVRQKVKDLRAEIPEAERHHTAIQEKISQYWQNNPKASEQDPYYIELCNQRKEFGRLKSELAFFEKMLNTGNFTYTVSTTTLGEYCRSLPNEKPRIILYLNSIKKSGHLAETFVHEAMHAYFDSDHSLCNNYIAEIEEALVEFAAIKFWACKEGRNNPRYAGIVREKKDRGTEHYGFGAYLYSSQHTFADQLCDEFYAKKYSLSASAPEVEEYKKSFEKGYPWDKEEETAELLGKAIGSTAQVTRKHKGRRNVAIMIPAGTTVITSGAFRNPDATSVAIPSSVTTIEPEAFRGCRSLRNVKISKDTKVAWDAFAGCPLETIIIADHVADNETFAYPKLFFDYPITSCAKTRICLETTRVDANTIPLGLQVAMRKRILNHQANGGSVELVLLDTVTAIAPDAFVRMLMFPGAIGLILWFRSIVVADEVLPLLPDGVRFNQPSLPLTVEPTVNGKKIIGVEDKDWYKDRLAGLLIIGRDVMTVGENAFDKCDRLTGVIVSNSVTELGHNAFSDCDSMRIALMGESVTDIHKFCFGKCVDLEDIQLPDSLTAIHSGAFWACASLEQIIIPDSVTHLSRSVFDACTSLSEVSLPSHITEIGSQTFHGCTSLETIVLPDTVEKIQGHAFEDCINLTSINIPRSLTTIYKHAFANCVNLRLTLRGYGIKLNGDPFEGCPHVTF